MESDQGKSFSAFWAFLMSLDKRDELASLVERVLAIPAIRGASKAFPLESLDSRLVGAGARVQDMTHRLNEELRYFLDERSRSEGLRVGQLVEEIKRLALQRRDDPPSSRDFLEIEGDPEFSLIMDRPLYTPEADVVIAERPVAAGRASVGTGALYDIDSVDLGALAENIRALLLESPQTSLSEATSRFPVTQGAAEILGYLALAEEAGQGAIWGSDRAHRVRRTRRSRPTPSTLR